MIRTLSHLVCPGCFCVLMHKRARNKRGNVVLARGRRKAVGLYANCVSLVDFTYSLAPAAVLPTDGRAREERRGLC